MKKNLLLSLGLLLLQSSLTAQTFIQWQKCLGGTSVEFAHCVRQTSDGGFVVAGVSSSNNGDVSGSHGNEEYWVVRLNTSGTILWQKCIGGVGGDIARAIEQTADGGFIVAGYSGSNDSNVTGNHGGSDYWVVKLDSMGEIDWSKCLGGTGGDYAFSVQQVADGGYVVAGYSDSNDGDVTGNQGNDDFWVVRLDGTGLINWEKTLGGSGNDHAYSVQQTADGGYIVAGSTDSPNNGDVTGQHGNDDYWVVKLDSTGSIAWQKCLGGTGFDVGYSAQQTSDGGYIITGNSNTPNNGDVTGNHGGFDYWTVKLDGSGSIDWQKSNGGSGTDYGFSIHQTGDGGYVAAGTSFSNNNDVSGNHGAGDFWIFKMDNVGTLVWQKCLGGTGNDDARSIRQTSDGGYIIAGFSASNDSDVTGNHGGGDFWVVKTTICAGFSASISSALEPNGFHVLCHGDSTASAVAAPSGGTGPFTYDWGNGPLPDSSISNLSAGTYSVTITDQQNCQATGSITITEPAAIDLTIAGGNSFCEGDSVQLTAAPGYSYLWSTNDTTQSIYVSDSSQVFVTLTDPYGCTGTSAPLAITENPGPDAPQIAIDPDSLYVTNAANVSYVWYLDGLPTTETTYVYHNAVNGIYFVIATDSLGCFSISDTIMVICAGFNATLSSPLEANGYNLLCHGDTTGSITAAPYGGTMPYTYDWGSGPVPDSVIANLPAGTYSVSIAEQTGCIVTVMITLTEPAPLDVTVTGSSGFCDGDSTQLTAANGYSYQWSTGETTQSIVLADSAMVYVTVTDSAGCTDSSPVISVVEFPLPVSPHIYVSADSLLVSNPEAGTYLWYLDGIATGSTGTFYIFTGDGLYSTLFTDSNGCSTFSDTVIITGIQSPETIRFTIHPNPSSGAFTLSFTNAAHGSAIRLFNELGQRVNDITTVRRTPTAIDIHVNARPGLYLLEVTDGNQVSTRKLIIQ